MARYHIAASGEPALCKALSDKNCPLGGKHYRSKDEAEFSQSLMAGLDLHALVEQQVASGTAEKLKVDLPADLPQYAGVDDGLRTSFRPEPKTLDPRTSRITPTADEAEGIYVFAQQDTRLQALAARLRKGSKAPMSYDEEQGIRAFASFDSRLKSLGERLTPPAYVTPASSTLENIVAAQPNVGQRIDGFLVVADEQTSGDDENSWRRLVLQDEKTGLYTAQPYRFNYFYREPQVDVWQEPEQVIPVPIETVKYEHTDAAVPADLTPEAQQDLIERVVSKQRWTSERFPYSVMDDEIWHQDDNEALHLVTVQHQQTGEFVQIQARHNFHFDDMETNDFHGPVVVKQVPALATDYVAPLPE
jgi:hypothetical protein